MEYQFVQMLLTDVGQWVANGRRRCDLYTDELLDQAKEFVRLNEVSRDVWDFVEAGIVFQTEQRIASSITSIIRHDMRGVLDTIIGFSRIILKGIHGPLAPDHAQDVTAIHQGGRRLQDFLDIMIENSKLENGEIKLQSEPINLIELVDQLMEKVKHERAQRSLRTGVIVAAQSDLADVMGDRYYTRLALQCLLVVMAAQDQSVPMIDVIQDDDGIQISCSNCMFREGEIDEIQGAGYKIFPHPLQLTRRLMQMQGWDFSIQPEGDDSYEIRLDHPISI